MVAYQVEHKSDNILCSILVVAKTQKYTPLANKAVVGITCGVAEVTANSIKFRCRSKVSDLGITSTIIF